MVNDEALPWNGLHVLGSILPPNLSHSIGLASALCAGYFFIFVGIPLVRAIANGPTLLSEKLDLTGIGRRHFQITVARIVAVLLSLAFLTGAVLGAACVLIVTLRQELSQAPSSISVSVMVAHALILALVIHAGVFLWDAAERPFVYQDILFGKGGTRAGFHVLLTDVIKPKGVVLFFEVAVALWLLFPFLLHPWTLSAVAQVVATSFTCWGLMFACRRCINWKTRGSAANADSAPRPNVLLVAADSLRADRLEYLVAPFLAHLKNRTAVFTHAYASTARTMPSWVTLLTGRFPHHHGVRHMFARWEDRFADLKAIPERFADFGYATAVVGDFAADNFPRTRLGFESIDTPTFNFRVLLDAHFLSEIYALHPFLRGRIATSVIPTLRALSYTSDPGGITRDALSKLDRIGNRPFFTTVVYSNCHFPYVAPGPSYQRFVTSRYRGPYKYGKDCQTAGGPEELSSEDLGHIHALYDGAVASIDEAVRMLFEGLELRGLDQNTIVVVTSDHGESLYESGRGQGHGDHLFGDEQTHVPLMIFDPRELVARCIPQVVRDVDLVPTLCELAGIPPPVGIDGRSLVPLMRGQSLLPELAYAETEIWFTETIPALPSELRVPYPSLVNLLEIDRLHDDQFVIRSSLESIVVEAKHRMVRDSRFKLIYAPTRSGVQWMLYDTLYDPAEVEDVMDSHPEVTARLKSALWDWMLQDSRLERCGDRLVAKPRSRQEHDQLETFIGLDSLISKLTL
jgi:hypothetical protein